MGTTSFDPDWVIAPSETLKEYMEDLGLKPEYLAVMVVGRDRKNEVLPLIVDVLERRPLGDAHAALLAKATGVSEVFWRNLEHNYRVGLAAGKKDISDD